ncbi:hypothetical protein [Aeromonas caviae]|uniref:hypothetical protein n=1 Tax=Aeromonas caviae TaxID=648 RepID=UPI0029D47243|nr:hypothetical protein [Aeromonas caviae]MDX7844706.1 hypothetical protein [Aeromonas caviae]MDX7946142.1 hypothetical protein [Aeromonas caviae]
MVDAKRGGARPGAGRPKGETTTMVRVPDGCLEQVRQLISVYRNGGELPSLPAQQAGDAHKQVDLPLGYADAPDPVKKAWEIYAPVFRPHPDFANFEPRYFKVFGALDPDYTYLFMLQMLERLQAMAFTESGPAHIYEMLNYKNLREYAQKLYKANPQWH